MQNKAKIFDKKLKTFVAGFSQPKGVGEGEWVIQK